MTVGVYVSTKRQLNYRKRMDCICKKAPHYHFTTLTVSYTITQFTQTYQAILITGEGFRNKIAFDGIDTSKFKDSVEPKLLLKMLILLADVFTHQQSSKTDIDFDSLIKEFKEYNQRYAQKQPEVIQLQLTV